MKPSAGLLMPPKKTEKTGTVRIAERLVKMLREIQAAAELLGEEFDAPSFLNGLVETPIAHKHEKMMAAVKRAKL